MNIESNVVYVYHTEHNKEEILSNEAKELKKAKSHNVPFYRNKVWLSRDNINTLKGMDTKYLLAAVSIIERNKGNSVFASMDGIAKLKDIKDELAYRESLVNKLLKYIHVGDMFKRNQWNTCKFFPSFTTKGISVR